MPQSFKFSREVKMVRNDGPHGTADSVRVLRLSVSARRPSDTRLSPSAALCGQVPLSPSPTGSAVQPGVDVGNSLTILGSTDSQNPEDDRMGLGSSSSQQSPSVFSSGQIIQILQQNPDLVVELKSQVADRCSNRVRRSMQMTLRTRCFTTKSRRTPTFVRTPTTFLRARRICAGKAVSSHGASNSEQGITAIC